MKGLKKHPEISLVLSTVGSLKEARKIAKLLVQEKQAACVSLVPKIESLYFWKGKLCQENEILLLIKTTQKQYSKLEKRLKELHPYQVPEILSFSTKKGNSAYLQWVLESVKPYGKNR